MPSRLEDMFQSAPILAARFPSGRSIAGTGRSTRLLKRSVSQAYCPALPIACNDLPSQLWERSARLVLEAAYEATFASAALNSTHSGNSSVYLTLIGGGMFGNEPGWIQDAIRSPVKRYRDFDLKVRIVGFRPSHPAVRRLCAETLR